MIDRYRKQNDEVYYMASALFVWDEADLGFLKDRALENPRRRCRLCAHPDSNAPVHEMLIVHGRDAYVRPHRHIGKAESFQVIEGNATAIFFDSSGAVRESFVMSSPAVGGAFYYRAPADTFHTLIIDSEWLVFFECTEGPFDPKHCEFAAWSPDGESGDAVDAYIESLKAEIGEYFFRDKNA